MLWVFIDELFEAGVFTSKQFAVFMQSAILTDFSICLSAVFYLIMGVIPAAKVRKGGKYGE